MSYQQEDIMRDEIERLRVEIARLNAWQAKVCAAVQPARTSEEWGKDVSDIIIMRLHELERLRSASRSASVAYDQGWKDAMNKVRTSCGLPPV